MKKLSGLLPVFAVAAGVALAAVTSAFKEAPKGKVDDSYTFVYNPPSMDPHPYSISNVQDKTHWSYVSGNDGCDLGNDEACRIFVTSNDVDPSGSSYVLKSGFSISAAESATNVAYVSSTSDGDDSQYISNKPE